MNQFLSTIPKGSFSLDYTKGISKAKDTEGLLRLTLVDHTDKKFVAVGLGYSLEEMVLKDWFNSITKSEDGQKRLKEIHESGKRELGAAIIEKSSEYYYIKAGKGLEHSHYLMTGLGLNYEPLYSSERKNAYKTGYFIENIGF